MRKNTIILSFISLFVLLGCGSKIPDDAIALVNGTALSEDELFQFIPRSVYVRMSSEDKEAIVREWVRYELLYQEGLRRKLDRESEITRILLNSRRNLIANETMERELRDIPLPDETEIASYYEENIDSFVLHAPEYNVKYAFFDDNHSAQEFVRNVRGNGNFSELAGRDSRDHSALAGGRLGTISEESVEPAVWNAVITAAHAAEPRISSPFRVGTGFGVVQVDAVYPEGTVKPLEALKEQIVDLLLIEKREEAKEQLLNRLEAKARINYNIR